MYSSDLFYVPGNIIDFFCFKNKASPVSLSYRTQNNPRFARNSFKILVWRCRVLDCEHR